MFRPGTVNEADYSPQEGPSSDLEPQSFGNIQKISQEGGKNTYVIILSKDCIKGDKAKGQPVINFPPVVKPGRAVQRRPPSIDVQDNEFDSPTLEDGENPHKPSHLTEDVKLNLFNINDDEYDSNTSATNVFLKPELIDFSSTHDSAIEADFSDSCSSWQDCTGNSSTAFVKDKSNMNSFVYPSPFGSQVEKKPNVVQHTFPTTSSQFSYGKQSLLHNNPIQHDRQSANSTARKIFLVTPDQGNEGVLKKSVAYTNEAVPVMGKSKLKDHGGSVSLLNKPNPKAVPTFSNISPINQTQKPTNSFVPINPSPPVAYCAPGPFTSTPVTCELNPRLQQLRQESSTHRPVYVIKSPFTRQTSQESSVNNPANDFDSSVIATSSVPTLNNSSGFISGSGSSLELFEASSSIDSPRNLPNRVYSPLATCDRFINTDENKPSAVDPLEDKSIIVKTYTLEDGGVVVSVDEDSMDGGFGAESETDPSVTSSQESDASDVVDKGILNKSLTNMQWLKGNTLKEEKITSAFAAHTKECKNIPWKTLTMEEIKGISEKFGREKKPPFSYMSLIEMALYSRDDRKMTLKEICQYIEDMFPYYQYTAKPGWKNSIRHNLSLYNIFERSPAKRHGSYWTIKTDIEPKMKAYRENKSAQNSQPEPLPSQSSGPMIPIIPMYSSMGQLSAITPGSIYVQPPTTANPKKKGPPPILPRPTPYSAPQTYALIPISNVGQQPYGTSVQHMSQPAYGTTAQAQQPMIVNLSNSSGQLSACPSPGITEMSAGVASIHVSSASPIPLEYGQTNTAHTEQRNIGKVPHINIVKQAWLDCQNVDTASSVESDFTSLNELTSSNEIASSSEFTNKSRGKSKRPRILNSGLPRPTMYVDKEGEKKLTGSKRRKLQQIERPLMNDSSEEEEDEGEKFISNLVKDLPIKSAENDMEVPQTTSTPFKKAETSRVNELPSPIPGLTPLRNTGIFDGSFLDTLMDKNVIGLGLSPAEKKSSPHANESPNASLLDFVTIPTFTSPDKLDGSPETSNPNLSKFLTECGLDPNFAENADTFPNLNWSSIQQMVDSMDITE